MKCMTLYTIPSGKSGSTGKDSTAVCWQASAWCSWQGQSVVLLTMCILTERAMNFVHRAFMQKYIGRGPVEFIPSGETKQRILFLVCHSYMLYLAHISDPLL